MLIELRLEISVAVVDERAHDSESADEDAKEGETFGAEREAVDADENEGERLEPEVEKAVGEGDVDVKEEANGFGEGEGEGADEDHEEDFVCGHALGFDFWLAFEVGVAGQFANAACAAVQDVARAGFGEEEDEEK